MIIQNITAHLTSPFLLNLSVRLTGCILFKFAFFVDRFDVLRNRLGAT
ncbi:Uncharacterised protein [Serratia entomophila]|nr:Uncharacterised protein [Serratia entomophila]CAI0993811.1 Uncharacterised protein [Serratia entomophila]CAI1057576.1 Uncharacterised protein [Serratia entomophila]CAI1063807.1 Uncharacterised protein [Serratia entomophila]CAI1079980.1 Uncharacterised protein [Serratia entomophila]